MLRRAIQKAKRVFLNDSCNIYRGSGSWHKTSCIVDGESIECLIIPPHTKHQNTGDKFGIIFDPVRTKGYKDYYFTHDIDCGGGRVCDRTRLKLLLNGMHDPIDPFDYVQDRRYRMYMVSLFQ